MKKRFYLFFPCFLLILSCQAQDTIKTSEITGKYYRFQEIYHVRKSDPTQWYGPFLYTYKGVKAMEGSYWNNLMDGDWNYYNSEGKRKYTATYFRGRFVRMAATYSDDGVLLFSDSVAGKKEYKRQYAKKSGLVKEDYFFRGSYVLSTFFYQGTRKPRLIQSCGPDSSMKLMSWYYPNGLLHEVVIMKNDRPFATGGCYDPEGNPLDQGNLKDGSGLLKTYLDTLAVKPLSEIEFKDGLMEGQAVYYHSNGKVSGKGNYKKGEKTGDWIYTTDSGKPDLVKNLNLPLVDQEKETLWWGAENRTLATTLPEFIGGPKEFSAFLRDVMTYPRTKIENEEDGKVHVTFVVTADGSIKDVMVKDRTQKLSEFELEAIRTVKLMPRWIPGFQNGRPVEYKHSLTIDFSISY